ncbi:hypothetical protein [Butyrivibrio sp. AE3004]|uniref:hypothetical protein n=1 Tax=Butyrivibrio sp. AE3004 TaxID=1506994 RepID=UPI0004945D05|nr:hypothetical protein [Butyrivibrio sp. AE3004]
MDILRINNYINIAKLELMEDAEFQHLHNELQKERDALNEMGYDPEKIINILYGIWCQRLGYILDHEREIDKKIVYTTDIEDFTLDDEDEE